MERLRELAIPQAHAAADRCPDHGHARMGGVRHSGAHQATRAAEWLRGEYVG
jgi:hypothetical protein